MEKEYDIVAMGELLIDFTPAGVSETGMCLYERNPGGAPVNMLTAAAKAGLRTAFIGKVGNDMHGKFLIEAVENQNINSDGIILDDNVFTTLAFVNLTKDGERSFAFARKPGADTMIGYKEVDTQILQNTKVFHVGSLSLTDEPARSTTFQAVKCAKNAGAVISYDPNYRAPLWNNEKTAIERMRSMLPFADMIKLSDEETALLTPYENPDEAANYLLDHGIKIVAVTLGKEGVLICNRKDHQKVSGFSSQVVDTTGAGDSFWGGFMSQFVKSKFNPEDCSIEELKKFARYGNAVASLCIEKKGGNGKFYGKLSNIEKQLKDGKIPFLRIHQSYLVNYRYVCKISYSNVILFDGTVLQISEDRQKEIRERYNDLLAGDFLDG